jgi:cobalt-zinc-cadmium efflux system protein
MDSVPEVRGVHHVHLWSLTPERPLLTLHVDVDDRADCGAVLSQVKAVLVSRFGIRHSTVQVEPAACADHGDYPTAWASAE